jgi:hypothetical protein
MKQSDVEQSRHARAGEIVHLESVTATGPPRPSPARARWLTNEYAPMCPTHYPSGGFRQPRPAYDTSIHKTGHVVARYNSRPPRIGPRDDSTGDALRRATPHPQADVVRHRCSAADSTAADDTRAGITDLPEDSRGSDAEWAADGIGAAAHSPARCWTGASLADVPAARCYPNAAPGTDLRSDAVTPS